ncbi:MAG: chemotaxis protein CheR [Oligoflexia bacterium]|nr:chemotaxis protein CheR [Oligoflexia bacterium]
MIELSEREFNIFRNIVQQLLGIRLSDSKKVLVSSRLFSRLRALNLNSFTEYINYLGGSNGNSELINFVDKITTNETYFFREEKHFEYLKTIYFPSINQQKFSSDGIRIWSACCSSGEEPYSIALTALSAYKSNNNLNIHILATDISTKVLTIAQNAIYPEISLNKFPHWVIKNFYEPISEKVISQFPFLQKGQSYIHLNKEVSNMVKLKKLNLMSERYPLKSKLDIIFCRNAMIYFDDKAKDYVINKFYDHLKDDGLFFIGHSENLFNYSDKFKLITNTIYQKINKKT